MKWSRTRSAKFFAVGAAAALLLTACGGDSDEGEGTEPEAGGTDSDEEITLTITTFNQFGYEDLYEQYMEENPNITIEATAIDTGGNARTDTFTKIAAGSGLTDIVAIEEGWLGAIMEVSDQFADLRDYGIEDRKADWLEWKYNQVVDQDGRVIGYGTDIGPEGICYRPDLFEAAGLPSDREAVAEYLDGDWAHFFDVGREYKEATGKAWYDHSGFIWNGIVNQMDEGYYTSDLELNVDGNAEMRDAFDLVAAAVADGLSAGQAVWDWNGGQSFVDGTFATFVCPGWMLGVVEGQVQAGAEAAGVDPASVVWDFADVFPGGPANWGGSFLTVAETSEHKEAAAALASWLTEPEQQLVAFEAAGAFPSTVDAAQALADEAAPRATFNDAPAGAILASRAQGIQAQVKGPDDSVIQENVFGPVLQQVDAGSLDADGAWAEALSLLDELVVNN